MDRKRMEEVARKRAPKRPKILDMSEGLTGGEVIDRLLQGAQPAKEPKQKIVLYLKEGLNPADKNFTKYPNDIHLTINERLKDMSEGVLYIYLWRQSWGFGRNYCRVSHKTVVRNTLIGSRSTSQKAMTGLISKHFVVKALTDEGSQNVDQTGALYRILTPSEIAVGRTEEGVLLDDLPVEGVPMVGIPIKSTPKNTDKQDAYEGIPINGTPNKQYTDDRHTDNKYTSVPTIGIPKDGILDANPHDESASPKHTDNRYTDYHTPSKEDSIKDTLSLVDLFYTGIGQKRISKAKREKGNKVVQELEADGFTTEDIQYAVEWTIDNAKEKLYDISILKHTIGQALAARDKQTAVTVHEEQLERENAEEIAERERIQALKDSLSEDERAALREKAVAALKATDGIKEQFISEPLINAKENEMLARQ